MQTTTFSPLSLRTELEKLDQKLAFGSQSLAAYDESVVFFEGL